jgi:hypothetical protein
MATASTSLRTVFADKLNGSRTGLALIGNAL